MQRDKIKFTFWLQQLKLLDNIDALSLPFNIIISIHSWYQAICQQKLQK